MYISKEFIMIKIKEATPKEVKNFAPQYHIKEIRFKIDKNGKMYNAVLYYGTIIDGKQKIPYMYIYCDDMGMNFEGPGSDFLFHQAQRRPIEYDEIIDDFAFTEF
jgi:hypothetical protein